MTDKEKKVVKLINEGMKHRDIARTMGISVGIVSTIRNRYPKMIQISTKKVSNEKNVTTTKEENGVHEIRHEGDEIITREDFFNHIDFDEKKFEILSYQCNIRPVVIRAGKNETVLVKKYEHFLRCKPRLSIDFENVVSNLEEKLKSFKYKGISSQIGRGEKLLEICLFDAHINKKSYDGEEWNATIAAQEYMKLIHRMIRKAKGIDTYERCLLIVGNDFMNSDGHSKTTRGTQQNNVEDEEESFAIGLEILVQAIETIQNELKCHVDVMSIPGNHAQTLETVMGISLKHIFKNNPYVHVDTEFKSRKYYEFGETAIMFSHGDGCKQDRIPMLFANEASELRGRTRYRQVHLGHIHTKTVSEVNGVMIKHLSSMTTTDKWHHEQGYVGNRRGGQMFIFDKYFGEEGCFDFFLN